MDIFDCQQDKSMELEEIHGTFQSPGLGDSSNSAHFDVSSAAQNDGSCLVSACFCVPGGGPG